MRIAYVEPELGKNGTMVHLLIHLHNADTRLCFSMEDGGAHGCGAAVVREKGGVHVDGAKGGMCQHVLRKDLPIGHHDVHVSIKSQDLLLDHGLLQAFGLQDGDVVEFGGGSNGGGVWLTAPSHWFVGLGDDGEHRYFIVQDELV